MNTKEENMHELARLLNIRENTMLAIKQVSDIFLKPIVCDAMEKLDDDKMEEFGVLVDRYNQGMDSLVDRLVMHSLCVYDKNFTEEEIASMIEFYSTPTGKRLIVLTPNLGSEAMRYAMSLSKQVGNKMFGEYGDNV